VHDAVDPPEAGGGGGAHVVLDDSTGRRLGRRHEAVLRLGDPSRQLAGLASPPVPGAFGSDDFIRNLPAGDAVDAASVLGTTLRVGGVLMDDFVAEDTRGRGPGVRDQGLLLTALALQGSAPELVAWRLARLRVIPWAAEAEEPVVRGPDVPAPAELRVVRIARRPLLGLPSQGLCRVASPGDPRVPGGGHERHVRRPGLPAVTAGVCRSEDLLDERLPPIKVDIPEDRAHHPALRRAAPRRGDAPVLPIPGLESVDEQPEDAVGGDALAPDRPPDLMVEAVDPWREVPRAQPLPPSPGLGHRSERWMAAAATSTAGRVRTELPLVVRLTPEADPCLSPRIRPGWQPNGRRVPEVFGRSVLLTAVPRSRSWRRASMSASIVSRDRPATVAVVAPRVRAPSCR